jgi:RNA polymerase sigma factor (sigma-70 family)
MYSKSVRRLAWKLTHSKLYDKWFNEDLIQQGFVGLMEAYEKYDSSKNCGHFWGFARKYVKGRMVDYAVQYFNYFKPSKKVNAVMVQIHKRNLSNQSPELIAKICGCSPSIASEALHFLLIRRPIYLFEPIRNKEGRDNMEFIDLIETNDEQDEVIFADMINESTGLESKVIALKNLVWNDDKEAQRLLDALDHLVGYLTNKRIQLAGGA